MTLDNLYELADKEEVTISEFCLNKREALSIMDEEGNCYIAIDPRRVGSFADKKTKVAHELGHCVTGAFYSVYSPFATKRRDEYLADKWAIKKLIPEDELKKAVSKGYVEPWELAEYFDVNEDFIRKAVSLYKHGNLYSYNP